VILISRYQTYFSNFLQAENHARLITFFCKPLYAFLFAKIIFLWPVLHDSVRYLPYEFTSPLRHVIYAPIKLAQFDLNAFLISTLILLLVAMVIRINYFTSALIFWLSFNLSRLAFPVANGSDYVLNLFLFLSVFLPVAPSFKSASLRNAQHIISNFAFLLCRTQLALIYVLSGFDKMTSNAWRTGDAVYSIINLDYFINPRLSISFNETVYTMLAWAIILFELSFPFLIWFKQFRVYVLVAGITFHIGIIFFLSLPDFGTVMIITYCLFIPEQWIIRHKGSCQVDPDSYRDET